jgi:hypothetical protein
MSIELKGNNESTFANDVTIAGRIKTSGDIYIPSASGNTGISIYNFSGTASSNNAIAISNVGGSPKSIELRYDGSATFSGTVSNPGVALNVSGGVGRQGSIEQYGTGGSDTESLHKIRSDVGGGGTVQWLLKKNGDATLRGSLTQSNSFLALDTGGTLDVKERLQNTQAALTSLKTAAAAASDFATLKAAIASALANI